MTKNGFQVLMMLSFLRSSLFTVFCTQASLSLTGIRKREEADLSDAGAVFCAKHYI